MIAEAGFLNVLQPVMLLTGWLFLKANASISVHKKNHIYLNTRQGAPPPHHHWGRQGKAPSLTFTNKEASLHALRVFELLLKAAYPQL